MMKTSIQVLSFKCFNCQKKRKKMGECGIQLKSLKKDRKTYRRKKAEGK